MAEVELRLIQRLATSGARAVESFSINGDRYLAVPQLACDMAGAPAGMNLGDSDVNLLIYKADPAIGALTLFQNLDVPGGEDAEFFAIDGRFFLATASLRSGKGPYDMDVRSIIFEWDGTAFAEFQRIPTFAAKQWHHFTVAGQHFLALAQGVELPGVVPKESTSPHSTIFSWNGHAFEPFQTVPSSWGYNWLHFSIDGADFLAYADHVMPSILLRWDGTKFSEFQTLDGCHGRAFCIIQEDAGPTYLAFARISSNSLLYQWNGSKFQMVQELAGPGGREFTLIRHHGTVYLFFVRFITGSRDQPVMALQSIIYSLQDGRMVRVAEFPTMGGTDVCPIRIGDRVCVAVSESLARDERFRTDSKVYELRFLETRRDQPKLKGNESYQCPEFLDLFSTFTGPTSSLRSELVAKVAEKTASSPLIVATSQDIIFYPDNSRAPSYINFRLGNRGFKELSAISHLGPSVARIVQMRQHGVEENVWRASATDLAAKIRAAQKANSVEMWRDRINVEAYRGREEAIAAMVDYACKITLSYIEAVLCDPTKLTPEFLRDNYLEATGPELGVSVPFNAIMIATFFLVGLDTSYRMRRWFMGSNLAWKNARVLITGRVGRETSGVTISTNSIAQSILQASDLQLPQEQLYIVPHVSVPAVKQPLDIELLRQQESKFRSLVNFLVGIEQLGEVMFSNYPAYKLPKDPRPVIDSSTTSVSELPKIVSPDDWFSLNTRLRVVLEDSRQLLSGCVTDYAAEQLRICNGNLEHIVIPGLDGFCYSYKETTESTITIADCPFPIPKDLPAPIKRVEARGGILAFRECGPPSARPVVWIHGLPLDSRSWSGQYHRFSKDYHNVFVDLRGYGSSTKLPTDATDITQIYCDDLLALMNHLAISEATVIAFASAGHVALRFCAQHQQRIHSMVLLNASPCFRRNGADYDYGFSEKILQEKFLTPAAQGMEPLINNILDPAVVFRDLNEQDAAKVSAWFRTMADDAGLPTLMGFFEHIVNDDDRHLVPMIRVPVLLLSAALGREVPRQTALYLRQHLQNAKLVEVPDADHFLNVTRPSIVNNMIASFLTETRCDQPNLQPRARKEGEAMSS